MFWIDRIGVSQCVIKYYCYNMFLFAVEAHDSGSALFVSWIAALGASQLGVQLRMELAGD